MFKTIILSGGLCVGLSLSLCSCKNQKQTSEQDGEHRVSVEHISSGLANLNAELDKLKQKYGEDKKRMAEEQMKLFKEHGINPTSGCLSQIVMIFILIGLYQVVQKLTTISNLSELNYSLYSNFLFFTEKDTLENTFLFMGHPQ